MYVIRGGRNGMPTGGVVVALNFFLGGLRHERFLLFFLLLVFRFLFGGTLFQRTVS